MGAPLIIGLIVGGVLLASAGVGTYYIYRKENQPVKPEDQLRCFPAYSGTLGVKLDGFKFGDFTACKESCEEEPGGGDCGCSRNLTVVFDGKDFLQVSYDPTVGLNSSSTHNVDFIRARDSELKALAVVVDDVNYSKHGAIYAFPPLTDSNALALTMDDEQFGGLTHGKLEVTILSQRPLKAKSCSYTGYIYDVDDTPPVLPPTTPPRPFEKTD